MRKTAILFLCICITFSLVLSGCGNATKTGAGTDAAVSTQAAASTAPEAVAQPAEKTTLNISWWGIETDPSQAIFKETIEKFNASNTFNATANITFTDSEAYKTKIAAQMAGNEAPDIFMAWAEGFLKPFVEAGKVYCIGDALDKDPEWKNRFIPGILDGLTFGGKVYAVPPVQTPVALFYNTEIFAKYNLQAPATYEELKNVIAVLNENGVIPIALGNKAAWPAGAITMVIANRIGGNAPFDAIKNGTGKWTDPSFIRSGEIMAELVKLNAFPKGFNAIDTDPGNLLFKTGKAGMLIMGSWAIQGFNDGQTTILGKIAAAKFPTIEGGVGSADVWLTQPDLNMGISENCKNKEAACAILKMISDPDCQTKLAMKGNLLATNTQLDPTKLDPVATQVTEMQKESKGSFLFYDVVMGQLLGNEYYATIQAITAGKDPTEAFTKYQQFYELNK